MGPSKGYTAASSYQIFEGVTHDAEGSMMSTSNLLLLVL
jgi:hypothetical protein